MRATSRRSSTAVAPLAAVVLLLGCSLAFAQVEPPRLMRPGEAADAIYVPRSILLERQFGASGADGWTFYQRVDDLPADVRNALSHSARGPIVNAGEPFNTGDINSYPSSAQHSFTATTDDVGVVRWYSAGFSGPVARVVLYDRRWRDACFYAVPRRLSFVIRLTDLQGLARSNDREFFRCEYQAPEVLAEPLR